MYFAKIFILVMLSLCAFGKIGRASDPQLRMFLEKHSGNLNKPNEKYLILVFRSSECANCFMVISEVWNNLITKQMISPQNRIILVDGFREIERPIVQAKFANLYGVRPIIKANDVFDYIKKKYLSNANNGGFLIVASNFEVVEAFHFNDKDINNKVKKAF